MAPAVYCFMLFVAVLFCGGVFAAARPKGLLSTWSTRLSSATDRGMLSHYISYPLLLCSTCMASIWGSFAFWLLVLALRISLEWRLLAWWALFVPCCAMGNFILWTVLDWYLRRIKAIDDGNTRTDPVQHH